jgi:uncharacterized membrane protein
VEARYLRIAYAIQFAVTWMAVFRVWAQVGGQGHLDLMPWYTKLLLPAALSLAAVKATAAAVRRDRIRNTRTSWWLAAALALIAAMGVLTYYEHLNEEPEEETPAQVELSSVAGAAAVA